MQRTHNYFLAVAVVIGIVFFIGITFFDTLYRMKDDTGMIIAQEVVRLRDVFYHIHKDCIIIDFDEQKNPINFLNVVTFTGSEVGPMNLVYPERWKGPYLQDNPTLYHIAYQVVSTKKGYFITPGEGVMLPNKKVIGRDIILDQKADIEKMMLNPQELLYKDKPLAARLDLSGSKNVQFFLSEDNVIYHD